MKHFITFLLLTVTLSETISDSDCIEIDKIISAINSIIDRNALRNSLLKLTEAPCGKTGSFRADGIGAVQLSFPIVGFHVNLPAIDHSEMASDEDGFLRLFLTDYRKALSDALYGNDNSHNKMNVYGLRARSGFHSTSSAYLKKNRVLNFYQNKYSVMKHRELAFSQS